MPTHTSADLRVHHQNQNPHQDVHPPRPHPPRDPHHAPPNADQDQHHAEDAYDLACEDDDVHELITSAGEPSHARGKTIDTLSKALSLASASQSASHAHSVANQRSNDQAWELLRDLVRTLIEHEQHIARLRQALLNSHGTTYRLTRQVEQLQQDHRQNLLTLDRIDATIQSLRGA